MVDNIINITKMIKKGILVAILGLTTLTVAGDEYTDPNTNVVYTYNANDDSAEVKAGWRVILGGNGEELSEEDFAGSPNVISSIAILDKIEIGRKGVYLDWAYQSSDSQDHFINRY